MAATGISPSPLASHVEPPTLSHSDVPNTNLDADLPLRSSVPPAEEPDFELPGMRFQKDGALKPGLTPPSPISGLDIKVDLPNIGRFS